MIANYSNSDALLEHLLMTNKHQSTLSSSDFDSMGNNDCKRCRVAFSECSQLHVYEPNDQFLLKSLCYTKEDQDAFSAESVREGLRIKNLIETAPHESIAESIKYLLRNRIITRGELVGVENYILGKTSNVLKLRRDHSAAVLRKQHEQRKQQLQDPMNLGKAAQISSVKSVQKARVRAAMAA
mmetsp:Transcript_27316/g.46425  ORF Transcript_27316/g.46425 Transcript_27316/m.46425 type:complete len:183 (-) Transcript_27316:80-628(-)